MMRHPQSGSPSWGIGIYLPVETEWKGGLSRRIIGEGSSRPLGVLIMLGTAKVQV